jgi:hypothetical protein
VAEPGGAVCLITLDDVTLDGERVPAEWAREARRLFAPIAEPVEPAPPTSLRLLSPDPADAALSGPPRQLRWSAVRGVSRYRLTLEVLTDATDQIWHPVGDLFAVEVDGTRFELPTALSWAPGALYRWRVETEDGEKIASARFHLLSESQREVLESARQRWGKSRLLVASVYRAFGCYATALDEVRALSARKPGDPLLRRAVLNLEADVRRQRAAETD